jgi:inorganic pyrophosphatase
MKKINFGGMEISIEYPIGSTREGINKQGKHWSQVMKGDYGYILGTNSPDGEHLDCYVCAGPRVTDRKVYVVHQLTMDGSKFDEDKVILNAVNGKEAKRMWERHSHRPRLMFGGMCEFELDHFKVMAFQSSNSKTMISSEETFKDLRRRGKIPYGIKSPVQTAKKVSESLGEAYGPGLERFDMDRIMEHLKDPNNSVIFYFDDDDTGAQMVISTADGPEHNPLYSVSRPLTSGWVRRDQLQSAYIEEFLANARARGKNVRVFYGKATELNEASIGRLDPVRIMAHLGERWGNRIIVYFGDEKQVLISNLSEDTCSVWQRGIFGAARVHYNYLPKLLGEIRQRAKSSEANIRVNFLTSEDDAANESIDRDMFYAALRSTGEMIGERHKTADAAAAQLSRLPRQVAGLYEVRHETHPTLGRMLTEGLVKGDLEGLLLPRISIDEYVSKDQDSDNVVVAFLIRHAPEAVEPLRRFCDRCQGVILTDAGDSDTVPNASIVYVEFDRRELEPRHVDTMVRQVANLAGMDASDMHLRFPHLDRNVPYTAQVIGAYFRRKRAEGT